MIFLIASIVTVVRNLDVSVSKPRWSRVVVRLCSRRRFRRRHRPLLPQLQRRWRYTRSDAGWRYSRADAGWRWSDAGWSNSSADTKTDTKAYYGITDTKAYHSITDTATINDCRSNP
jgi:hypothetical protein